MSTCAKDIDMPRQGRPVGLIIAVVAVAAAGLLLWLILRSGDEDAAASPPQTAGGPAAPSGHQASGGERGERPSLPSTASPAEGRRRRGSGDAERTTTETIINGVRVRDHRRDRSKPIVIPPRPPPAHARKIAPELTREISNRILPIVRECASQVPPEARGGKPRVEGQVVIAIKGQQVQISQATIEISDVVGASLEPAKQCIQDKTLGVTVPASEEADLVDYPIRLSYTLP
jgi:hypothetical protein